ncbi:uncharacterized protein BDZ99DRAFT_470924 [Mytilinidion resinicola]|uniref:F-box domain-containing protein n=1 Tax=Mytilinidion resinicola TaxID=574789 RepID=A0A6A6ZCR4_9PEZI|nr:uncharacterized protein BDZ99DRAFT_470924 [Mytilinidion resinicola]KAF2817997.1 hypothetical protein BDZ99DRAFT_470924 [Mytilinidion resinicola]
MSESNSLRRPSNRPGFRPSDLREGNPHQHGLSLSHLQDRNIPLVGLPNIRVRPGKKLAFPNQGSDQGYGYDRIFVACWVDRCSVLLEQRISRSQSPQNLSQPSLMSKSTLGFLRRFLDLTSRWPISKRPHDIAVHTYIRRSWLLNCPGEIVDLISQHLSRSDFLEFRSTCKDIHQKTLYRLNNIHLPNKTLTLASNSRAGLNSLVGLAGHQKFAARVRQVTIQVQDSSFLWGKEISPLQHYFGDPALAFEEGLWTQHFNNPSMQMEQRAIDLAIVLVCLSKLTALKTVELIDIPSGWIPVQHAQARKDLQEAKKAVKKSKSAIGTSNVHVQNGGPHPGTADDRLSRAAQLYKKVMENSRAGEAGKPVGAYTPYSITTKHCGICKRPPFKNRASKKCIHFQVFLDALVLLARSQSDLVWSMGVYQLPSTMANHVAHALGSLLPTTFKLHGLLEISYKIYRHKGIDDLLPTDGPLVAHNFIFKLLGASTILQRLSIDGADVAHRPSKTHRLCGPVGSRLATGSLSTLVLQDLKLSAPELVTLFVRYATTLSTIHLEGVCLVSQLNTWSAALSYLLTNKAPLKEVFIHASKICWGVDSWGMVVFGDTVSKAELKGIQYRPGHFLKWRQRGREAPHQEMNRDLVGWRFCGPSITAGVTFLVHNAHLLRV